MRRSSRRFVRIVAATVGRLYDAADGDVSIPEQTETVAPRFLDGTVPAAAPARRTRRLQLPIWIASRDNPYLARAIVNRTWSQLFGRGIVNPVDDLGPHNPPMQPALLEELSDYFVRRGFDLRDLIKVLTQTRAYQLSSRPGTGTEAAGLAPARRCSPSWR